MVDSIEHTRQVTESGQAHVLAVQGRLAEEQARIRRALSLIDQAEIQALQHIFVRDSPPIWNLQTNVGAEWRNIVVSRFLCS